MPDRAEDVPPPESRPTKLSVVGCSAQEDGHATRTKFPIEVMLRAMREVDNGVPVAVVCRKVGMVEKTFYRYREKYAGMAATEARRLRELEKENARLKKLLSEQ